MHPGVDPYPVFPFLRNPGIRYGEHLDGQPHHAGPQGIHHHKGRRRPLFQAFLQQFPPVRNKISNIDRIPGKERGYLSQGSLVMFKPLEMFPVIGKDGPHGICVLEIQVDVFSPDPFHHKIEPARAGLQIRIGRVGRIRTGDDLIGKMEHRIGPGRPDPD